MISDHAIRPLYRLLGQTDSAINCYGVDYIIDNLAYYNIANALIVYKCYSIRELACDWRMYCVKC